MRYPTHILPACIIILALVIIGCSSPTEEKPMETEEEAVGTGILDVRSIPAGAQVFVDGELKGESPLMVYNLPGGSHNVAFRKQGYNDAEKPVIITPGRTEILEQTLDELSTLPNQGESQPASTSSAEAKPQAEPQARLGAIQTLDLIGGFAMYYDFDNKIFGDKKTTNTDVFSKNYNTYLYFTAFYPSKLGYVDKPIEEITEDDCKLVNGVVTKLLPGQTLCVRTVEGSLAAIGGDWAAGQQIKWTSFD